MRKTIYDLSGRFVISRGLLLTESIVIARVITLFRSFPMKYVLLLTSLIAIGTTHAQTTEDPAAEDLILLSPFTVSSEADSAYRARAAGANARMINQLVDPSWIPSSQSAVSLYKPADAVAIQFVLSHTGDRQDVRNQELYASVEALEKASQSHPGMRLELREVRFTGGDKKLFSSSRGGSTASFVSILLLADLRPNVRVADRVKEARDLIARTKLVGQTKYSDGAVGLYLRNPDQYRREILQKIFEDIEFMKRGFAGEFEIQPSGLNGKVRMRVASESELELWIDYGIAFRSIRELQADKE